MLEDYAQPIYVPVPAFAGATAQAGAAIESTAGDAVQCRDQPAA
jgi:hypothetical protein